MAVWTWWPEDSGIYVIVRNPSVQPRGREVVKIQPHEIVETPFNLEWTTVGNTWLKFVSSAMQVRRQLPALSST